MISVYHDFIRNTYRLRSKADAIYAIPRNHQDWRFKYASISLISEIWQCWCRFCYEVIYQSCRGTQLRNGSTIPQRLSDNSRQRIAYEIKEFSHGHTPKPRQRLRYKSEEPTWGDVDLLLRAIPYLGIANSTELTTAFGISVPSPSHLQIVRNACNHLDSETMQRVRSIQPYYIGSIQQPYELIWCLESNTRSDAIFVWISDLELIAKLAT